MISFHPLLGQAMDLGIENPSKAANRKLDDEEHPASELERLPRDIFLDIISRLPLTSLMRFRSVNRNCNLLSYDPNLVSPHFSHSLKGKNPSLILHSNSHYPVSNYLYYVEFSGSDHHDKEIMRKIQTPFCEVNVIASCNGLICVSDYSHRLYIYNPFSKGRKELPVSMAFHKVDTIGFGYHPLISEYKVVLISGMSSEVHVYSLGDGSWRKFGRTPYFLERQASQALVNGRFHWFTKQMTLFRTRFSSHERRKIVSFDLLDEQFREIPIPIHGRENLVDCHLSVLGELLSAVFCCPLASESFEIWVMEEYNVKESWVNILRVAVPSLFPQEQFLPPLALDRVLCLLKNGNILVHYQGGGLVSHDPKSRTSMKLMIKGLPNVFEAFAHLGSLNWIDTPILTSI